MPSRLYDTVDAFGGSTSEMTPIARSIAATNLKPCGEMMTPYTGVLGDETMFLLEGEVEIIETVSGKRHSFRAGDVVGLSSGMHITWVSKGPFVKKLWVITRDVLPS